MGEFGKEVEDYFCRFTFGQFVTLILLELVTLFFVFYLGARYGPDLMGGRKESSVAKEATPEEKPSGAAPSVNYTFPELLLEGKEGKGVKFKPSGMTAREYERKLQEDVREEPTPVIVPAPEKVIETPPAPKKSVVTEVTPESAGKYTIQVGSYKTASEAAAAVNKWKEKGYSSSMTVGEIPNKGTWYRVRIGNFKSREEAERYLQKFRQKERTDALVVSSKS